MQTQDYVRELITTFFIRKWVIGGITLAALLLGAAVVLLWPAVYRAEGSLILKGSNVLQSEGNLGQLAPELEPLREEDLYSEREILTSQDVVKEAVASLAKDGKLGLDSAQPAAVEGVARRVRGRLSASLIPRTNVIEATVMWSNPAEAKLILGAVFDEYLNRRQAVFNPREAEAFFESQLETFRQGLEDLEQRLLEETGGTSVEDLQGMLDRNLELHADLRQELSRLLSERVQKSEYVDFLTNSLKEKDGYNLFTAIDSLELGDFGERIQDVLVKREEELKIYEPTSVQARRTQEQLDRLYGLFRAEAERFVTKESRTLEGVDANITSVRERLAELKTENQELYQNVIQARRLGRERKVMEESYDTFATRFREAKIRNETNSEGMFNVAIVEQAHAGRTPVFPNAGRVMPLSLLLGLLFGITTGFLVEFFDHRFKRPTDISNYTDLKYLFSVPRYD
jgi:uncharacterized protein involved in exopolysaccharide biosynthesis